MNPTTTSWPWRTRSCASRSMANVFPAPGVAPRYSFRCPRLCEASPGTPGWGWACGSTTGRGGSLCTAPLYPRDAIPPLPCRGPGYLEHVDVLFAEQPQDPPVLVLLDEGAHFRGVEIPCLGNAIDLQESVGLGDA